jgi:hypothetical protein
LRLAANGNGTNETLNSNVKYVLNKRSRYLQKLSTSLALSTAPQLFVFLPIGQDPIICYQGIRFRQQQPWLQQQPSHQQQPSLL